MDNPNYVALSICVAVAFLLYRLRVVKRWKKKVLPLLLILFLLFVFPVTGSRTGLAILLAMAVLTFVFADWRSKIATVAVVIAAFFALDFSGTADLSFGPAYILANRVQKKDANEDVRVPVWRGALRLGSTTWFTGIGIGQFKAQFSKLFKFEYNDQIVRIVDRGAHLSTHSDFVGLLVIYGAPGLLLYLFYLFDALRSLWQRMRYSKSPRADRFFRMCFLLLTSLVIFGLGSENFLSPLYWIVLAMATVSIEVEEPPASNEISVPESAAVVAQF